MSKDESIIGNHKNGRPPNIESAKICKILHDYYLQGTSPAYVIQKTGLNKNTVYSKFKELDDLAKNSNTKDFLEAYEAKKTQFIISIEDLICRSYKVLTYTENRLENYQKKNQNPPEFLLQKFSDMIKNIMNLQKEKANPTIKIPLGKELQNKIIEEVENSNG